MVKIYSKTLLILYLLLLVWLILFKLNFNLSDLVKNHHSSLNLIPFGAPKMENGRIIYSEMLWNGLFFFPLGLLLNVNFKIIGFFKKLIFIMLFSLFAEVTQYIFSIGAADITDLITNTLGGFVGLVFYDFSSKLIKTERLDRVIIFVGTILLIVFLSIHFSHFMRRTKFR